MHMPPIFHLWRDPGSWFTLAKCMKNICGKVAFYIKMQINYLHFNLKCHSSVGVFHTFFLVSPEQNNGRKWVKHFSTTQECCYPHPYFQNHFAGPGHQNGLKVIFRIESNLLIESGKIKTGFQNIKCGVPKGSILGPLLFRTYINSLYRASNFLHRIVFADDTNPFFLIKTSRICLEQIV